MKRWINLNKESKQPTVVPSVPAKSINTTNTVTTKSVQNEIKVPAKPVENSTTTTQKTPEKPKPVFQIHTAKTRPQFLKMVIYGDFGVGKTTLAASAQDVREMSDVIFIDAESGTMTINDRDDIDVITVADYKQFARVYEFMREHCKYRDQGDLDQLAKFEIVLKGLDPNDPNDKEQVEAIRTKPKQYRTVVIDSLTEVQKYCMYQLTGVRAATHSLDLPPDAPQFKEWGQSREMIGILVRQFRNLPLHTIFVCGRQEETDELKRMHYAPNLPGKLAHDILGFVDVTGFYQALTQTDGSSITRRLWLSPQTTFKAKNRFKHFEGSYIDNPTMEQLLALL